VPSKVRDGKYKIVADLDTGPFPIDRDYVNEIEVLRE
jgi:hypothetical protein